MNIIIIIQLIILIIEIISVIHIIFTFTGIEYIIEDIWKKIVDK